jgi:hypothetical protein
MYCAFVSKISPKRSSVPTEMSSACIGALAA